MGPCADLLCRAAAMAAAVSAAFAEVVAPACGMKSSSSSALLKAMSTSSVAAASLCFLHVYQTMGQCISDRPTLHKA